MMPGRFAVQSGVGGRIYFTGKKMPWKQSSGDNTHRVVRAVNETHRSFDEIIEQVVIICKKRTCLLSGERCPGNQNWDETTERIRRTILYDRFKCQVCCRKSFACCFGQVESLKGFKERMQNILRGSGLVFGTLKRGKRKSGRLIFSVRRPLGHRSTVRIQSSLSRYFVGVIFG